MLNNKSSFGSSTVLKPTLFAIALGLLMCVNAFGIDIIGEVYNENSTSGYPGSYINDAKVCARQGGVDIACAYSSHPTSNTGVYQITGLSSGTYDLCVTKPANADLNGKITSSDAARITNHLNGSNPFTSDFLEWAADTNCDLTLDSTDVSKVSAFVAGLPGLSNCTGQWRFVPDDTSAPWPLSDASVCLPVVLTADLETDFVGILKGEVTGNWVH